MDCLQSLWNFGRKNCTVLFIFFTITASATFVTRADCWGDDRCRAHGARRCTALLTNATVEAGGGTHFMHSHSLETIDPRTTEHVGFSPIGQISRLLAPSAQRREMVGESRED